MSQKYSDIWEILKNRINQKHFAGPLENLSLISDAEKTLSISFSPNYKKYLQIYGGGGPGSFWLYGLKKHQFAHKAFRS